MKRRDFLKAIGVSAAALSIGGEVLAQEIKSTASIEMPPEVVWVENGEPAFLLQSALKEMGGMGKFVAKGDTVVVKPNIGWDRAPELAGCTNPDLVAEIVKECLNAGAKKVKIFDRTCNNALRCYASSQIEEKATAAGAEVSHIDDNRFKMVSLKSGEILKEWPIYQDYLEADKVINVPVAKHHRLATITLGMKNLMGVMGSSRGQIHGGTDGPFHKKLIDIVAAIFPTLTIIDAYRILLRNGPVGGNPEDVKLAKTLVMSPCTVTADYAALPLFGHEPENVEHIKEAMARKLQKFDLAKLRMKKITLS